MLLFTDYERAWDGERLSDIFSVAMGFQEYRQVITKFMRKHMKELDWQGKEDGDDVRDKALRRSVWGV
jgi:hypothetical protein